MSQVLNAQISAMQYVQPIGNYTVRMPRIAFAVAPTKSVQEMVQLLRSNGLPVATIAEIARVERKTVYSWLDGNDVRSFNEARVETAFRLINSATTDLRTLHRLWNRRLSTGRSLKEFLCADTLSEMAISDALTELRPMIVREAEKSKRSSPVLSPGRNSAIDDMPVAMARN